MFDCFVLIFNYDESMHLTKLIKQGEANTWKNRDDAGLMMMRKHTLKLIKSLYKEKCDSVVMANIMV